MWLAKTWFFLFFTGWVVCQDEEYNVPDYTPPEGMEVVGDMILPNATRNRNLILDKECYRWPEGKVPYVHDGTVDNFARIETAMRTLEKHTCIRFRDIGGDLAEQASTIHINIHGTESSCFSHVGRICFDQLNEVGMAPGCQNTDGTPVHELMHSLGLYHEQSRVDRDEYVTIVEANIRPDTLRNFDIETETVPLNDLNVPYDYYSDMHYPKSAFSINGSDTIITKDDGFQDTIGLRLGPSFIDVKKINEAYNCAADCPEIQCRLENDCFVNSNCRCVCADRGPEDKQYKPEDDQTDEDPVHSGCGGIIELSTPGQQEDITHFSYSNNEYCRWTIRNTVQTNMTRVGFKIYSFDFGPGCNDHLYVNKRGTTDFSESKRLCGSRSRTFRIKSKYRRLSLQFTSDDSGTYSGFTGVVYTICKRRGCR